MISQCENIIRHMQEHGSITPLEAFNLYKSLACHSRIAELRERGHNIITEMVETPSGKVVGKYTLRSRQNAPQRTPVALDEPYAVGQLRRERGRMVEVVGCGVAHDGLRWVAVRDA